MLRSGLTYALASAWIACLATSATAQVPTVAGRSFNLSRTGHTLFIPSSYIHRPQDATDILVHFHGDPATYRNNVGYAKLNAVSLTVNLGQGSTAYATPYTDTALFGNVLTEARNVLRGLPDFSDTLNFDKLAVTSFSAGYGAVREILKQPTYFNDIDAMVLADTVYGSYTSSTDHTPLDSQMTGFRSFAAAAKNGTKTLTVSHSKVLTFTYSNTEETADDLMAHVGVTPAAYNAVGLGNLQFYRRAITGNFSVYGATGADAAAHSKHLQNIGQFLDDLPLAIVPEPGGVLLIAAAGLLIRRTRCGADISVCLG
jgi:hypothetical protein